MRYTPFGYNCLRPPLTTNDPDKSKRKKMRLFSCMSGRPTHNNFPSVYLLLWSLLLCRLSFFAYYPLLYPYQLSTPVVAQHKKNNQTPMFNE
jgi:hypothetical protein